MAVIKKIILNNIYRNKVNLFDFSIIATAEIEIENALFRIEQINIYTCE